MIGFNAQQTAIVAADVKTDISWLFEIDRTGNGSVDDYFSTKAKTFGGQAYTFKVCAMSDIALQRNRSEFGMQSPGKFTFSLANASGALDPSDFAGGEVTVRHIVKALIRKATVTVTGGTKPAAGETMTGATSGKTAVVLGPPDAWTGAVTVYFSSQSGAFEAENVTFSGSGTGTIAADLTHTQEEAEIAAWGYAINAVTKAYGQLNFTCTDWITKYLEGTYPKTQNLGLLYEHYVRTGPFGGYNTRDKIGSGISDTCPPVIFGDVFIPLYPTIIDQNGVRGDAYYVLGAGSGATAYEFVKMLSEDQATTWEPGAGTGQYTVAYTDLVGTDGVTYVGLVVKAVDADGDGYLDSNPVVKAGETYSPMFVKYRKGAGGTDYTSPADILSYILQGFGIPAAKLDATTLASFKTTCTTRGIAWSFGLYQPTDRKRLIADLLLQCDCELIIRDKIYFKAHSKTSVRNIDVSDVARSTFQPTATTPSASDSGYVQHRVFAPADVGTTTYAVTAINLGVCACAATTGLAINDFVQFTSGPAAVLNKIFKVTAVNANVTFTIHDTSISFGAACVAKEVETSTSRPDTALTRSLITASGTTDSPTTSNDMPGWAVTLTGTYVPDATVARTLGTLGLQRVLNAVGSVSFQGKARLLGLEPDDVITITDDLHGAGTGKEYAILIDTIRISKDLRITITGTRYSPALSDFSDIIPATISIVNGQIVQTYSPVVSGPDKVNTSGVYVGNVLRGRLRVGETGNYILLDPTEPLITFAEGGQDRLKIGDLGTDDWGIEFLDHAGNSIFKLDGAGVNTLSGWNIDATSFTKTASGNTVTLSTGSTAIAAGPTGAPTFTVTQAGVLSASGATISGMVTGSYVYGSSLMTKGTYLATTCGAGDATLSVGDTTDFPASGTASFIDSTNDRDTFTYTGKTASTLTGCSGVLAHTVSASNKPLVVPGVKGMYINDAVNEMRFFGDRGDGVTVELANIGINPSGAEYSIIAVGATGTSHIALSAYSQTGPYTLAGYNSNYIAVYGQAGPAFDGFTGQKIGVYGDSNAGYGVVGNSNTNHGVYGKSVSGNGIRGKSDSAYSVYSDGTTYLGGNATILSGSFLGLGAAKGRIVFTDAATGDITFYACNIGIDTLTASKPLFTDANKKISTGTQTGTGTELVASQSPIIVTPTIASFANAQHNHSNAAGGGSVTLPAACVAWINFNGGGVSPTINASYNVTSITDNGTGDYTINFTNALADAYYAAVVSFLSSSAGPSTQYAQITSQTNSALRILLVRDGSANDGQIVNVAVFR